MPRYDRMRMPRLKPRFDQAKFNEFAAKFCHFLAEPRMTSSGRPSNFYINWRDAAGDAYLLNELANWIADFLIFRGWKPQSIVGVPEGMSYVGVVSTMKISSILGCKPGSHALAMIRGKPKSHGDPKDRDYVGLPKGVTVVLEDVATTGDSLCEEGIDTLLKLGKSAPELGLQVKAAMSLTDRMQKRSDGLSVADYLHNRYGMNLSYFFMSNAPDVLQVAARKQRPGRKILSAIEREYKEYGVREFRFG